MYCSLSDIIGAVSVAVAVRYLDDDGDGVPDEQAWRAVQDSVTNVIESHVGRVYTVETLRQAPPPLLRTIAVDLSLHRMGMRRPEFTDQQGRPQYHYQGNLALDTLRDIGAGKVRLDVNGTPETPANVSGSVRVPSSAITAPLVTSGFVRNGSGDF